MPRGHRKRAPTPPEESLEDSVHSDSQPSQASTDERESNGASHSSSAPHNDHVSSQRSSSRQSMRNSASSGEDHSSSPPRVHKSKVRNGAQPQRPPSRNEMHVAPSSTPSSGFSSAMSDASAHSTTSGTSSPYASGSVFHRLNANDLKYRDEKPKILRSYIVGKMLGEGSYGKVKEGIDSKTKKMVAIKILSKKSLRRVPGGEASVEREIGIIESLHHKNIISIQTHFLVEAKQKYYIVFDYMGGGNLTSFLETAPNRRLPLYQARKLFSCLIGGLEHLREHRILHRDIKPDNLLLDSNGDLKIADFGVAEVITNTPATKERLKDTAGIGSPAFQAPELISSSNTTPSKKSSKRSNLDLIFKSDIWSAGIVLFIMVVGEYPFPIQGNIMLLFEDIAAGKFEVPDWVDPTCTDLITQMLKTNPTERIDLAEIREHPFMKNSIPKTPSVQIHQTPSMWPHHDKSSLSAVIKKMKPQLEREEEQERASRFSMDERPPEEAAESSHSSSHQNKCAIM